MGIERFFNSLRNDYNSIIADITPNKKLNLSSENLFIDFNSIAHVISQRILGLVNNLMLEIILENNGCGNKKIPYLKNELGSLITDFKDPEGNEENVIKYFKSYFTKEKLDEIIINFISIYVLDLLRFFNKEKLKILYLGIDGVPSKAKIVEQKKRRFMGEFDKNIKQLILEDHKKELDIDKDKKCKTTFNKYKFLKNQVSWSRSNISPATSFMIKLDNYLNSNIFKIKVQKFSKSIKLIVSGFREDGEAEMKIMNFIRDNDNKINGSICIYSPDADVILLALLIETKSIIHLLRHDQQKSEPLKEKGEYIYNLIKVNDLRSSIYNFINKNKLNNKKLNLENKRVIDDIVFIFTILGDDFLHKIESFDVRNDINMILDIYQQNHINSKSTAYLLDDNENKKNINFKNFVSLLKLMSDKEDEMLKRNFFNKKYWNYKKIINIINKSLKGSIKNDKFKKIDHNNVSEFIEIYNFNYTIDNIVQSINKLINKFITIEVKPNLKSKYSFIKDEITIHNINLVPEKDFINFFERVHKSEENDIYYNLREKILNNREIFKNFINLFKKYSKDFDTKSNDNQIIKEIILYYFKNKKFPEIKDEFKVNIKNSSISYLYLREYNNTLKSPYHKRISQNFSGYEKNIYKFEHMLEEYKDKLNSSEDNILGNPENDSDKNRDLYYKEFFNNNKIQAMQNYFDGLQWVLDYYYNGITYHKWYYLYNRSPLIKDLYKYILNYKDDFFLKSRQTLEKCCSIKKTSDMLSPFEQLLYITPFDKKLSYLNMFNEYSNQDQIRDIVGKLFQEFRGLYPDIYQISKKVYESKSNNEIDCRGAFYLNKCILNVIHDSNMINEQEVKDFIRKMISIDYQVEEYVQQENDKQGYLEMYMKYKKLYKLTGELDYKNKYKYYRYISK